MSKKKTGKSLNVSVDIPEIKETPKAGGFDGMFDEEPTDIPEVKNPREYVAKKEKESRATFVINETMLEELRAVAYWERKKIKEVLQEALEWRINKYKKANDGKLDLPKK